MHAPDAERFDDEPTRFELDELAELLTAFAQPLRFAILLGLDQGRRSPKMLSAEIAMPLGRVSHHIRALVSLGLIECMDTAVRRGAIEHFYERTPLGDELLRTVAAHLDTGSLPGALAELRTEPPGPGEPPAR